MSHKLPNILTKIHSERIQWIEQTKTFCAYQQRGSLGTYEEGFRDAIYRVCRLLDEEIKIGNLIERQND